MEARTKERLTGTPDGPLYFRTPPQERTFLMLRFLGAIYRGQDLKHAKCTGLKGRILLLSRERGGGGDFHIPLCIPHPAHGIPEDRHSLPYKSDPRAKLALATTGMRLG